MQKKKPNGLRHFFSPGLDLHVFNDYIYMRTRELSVNKWENKVYRGKNHSCH